MSFLLFILSLSLSLAVSFYFSLSFSLFIYLSLLYLHDFCGVLSFYKFYPYFASSIPSVVVSIIIFIQLFVIIMYPIKMYRCVFMDSVWLGLDCRRNRTNNSSGETLRLLWHGLSRSSNKNQYNAVFHLFSILSHYHSKKMVLKYFIFQVQQHLCGQ